MNPDWRAIVLGGVLGAVLGWLAAWWRSRDARRVDRELQDAIRAAEATVARAGPILQREIVKIEDEIARQKPLH